MQFYLLWFYTLSYLFTFLFTWLYLINFTINLNYLKTNFKSLLHLIYFYYPQQNLFWISLIALSGLPPVLGFFIKFNLFILTSDYWDLFFLVLIIIYLYTSTMYYLQFFQIRSLNYNELYNLKISKKKNNSKNSKKYTTIFFVIITLLINFFSFFFFTDLTIIILNLFILWI